MEQLPLLTSNRRGNSVLLLGILLIGCLVGAVATVGWNTRRQGNAPAWPNAASLSVTAWRADPKHPIRHYRSRDHETMAALQSMLVVDSTRLLNTLPSGRRSYSVQFPTPTIAEDFGEIIDVWDTKRGQAWVKDDATYIMNGDLELFLQALPARRLVQMLTSEDVAERDNGRRLKESLRDDSITSLLNLCNSENSVLQSFALKNLWLLIQEKIPRYDEPLWHIRRNQKRAVSSGRAEDIRRAALSTLEGALNKDSSRFVGERYNVISYACGCLAEAGNQATADELARLLASEAEAHAIDHLMECLEAVYGLPPSYEKGSMCGNSSPQEIAAFGKQEGARRTAARGELLQWHVDHANEGRERVTDAIIEKWSVRLLDLGMPRMAWEQYEPIPAKRFASLLRSEAELAPAIERRKLSASLVEKGALEFISAYWTANCDSPLVDQLLAGDARQQILACNIIAASGRTDWRDCLDGFQYAPFPKDDPVAFKDVQMLRSAATAALLMCLGQDALPLIEAADRAGCWNGQAEQILRFYNGHK